MSTSKHYPYFGTMDNDTDSTSYILQVTSPHMGVVVWSSHPGILPIGQQCTDVNEEKLTRVVDPFTIKYLLSALAAIQKADTEQQMYVLSYNGAGTTIDSISDDIDKLKVVADTKGNCQHIWTQVGVFWCGKEQEHDEDFYWIQPVDLV